ncbi:hypothetical protein [Psychroflexus sp. MES1-P1E]|uniref:hypothetical protein n=1 Tax=Psychroflexus sp. MES1-P1E TaxID=2058320 RepID=UPI000C7B8B4F|nr:hypothetical protein [Psychroflexus sp. MES1-P1E]PKG44343.1 hypothetical protein CXF67_00125 [Psychroflexus sp. MES1-P1E]
MADDKVNIELTKEEAIVLFEFLGRFNETDDLNRFEDQSEQRVLWDVERILEKELSEPFRADYQEIVKKARETVRDEKE